MKIRPIIITFLLPLLFSACEEAAPETIPSTPLVVDGWIDEGGAPVVLVSRTLGPSESLQDKAALLMKVITYATVRVSDGTTTVTLKGRRDDNYIPPFIYTTDEMTGEAGKTYRLDVSFPGINAWAETTLPAKTALDRLEVKVSERDGDLYGITAHFKDNPATRDWYKFFTMVEGVNTTWNSSFLGALDDATLDSPDVSLPVSRGWWLMEKSNLPLFRKGETVHVKFCTVDETTYLHWKTYDDATILSRNPFFPVSGNVVTNMHGALGFWAGYGASFYDVTID